VIVWRINISHLEGKDNAYAKRPVKSFMASFRGC